jgi:hypothetical protein
MAKRKKTPIDRNKPQPTETAVSPPPELIPKKPATTIHPERRTQIVHAICSLHCTGKWTLESCCESQGIPPRTYRNWLAKHPELSEIASSYTDTLLEQTKRELIKKSYQGLDKLLQERPTTKTTTVTKVEAGKEQVAEIRVTEETIQPTTQAIIFALTNLAADVWKNKTTNETKFSGVMAHKDVTALSDDELEKEIARLTAAIGISVATEPAQEGESDTELDTSDWDE